MKAMKKKEYITPSLDVIMVRRMCLLEGTSIEKSDDKAEEGDYGY